MELICVLQFMVQLLMILMAYFHCWTRIQIRTQIQIPVLFRYYGKRIWIWICVSGNMFCMILCSHRGWNPSPNLNPSPAVEMSHYTVTVLICSLKEASFTAFSMVFFTHFNKYRHISKVKIKVDRLFRLIFVPCIYLHKRIWRWIRVVWFYSFAHVIYDSHLYFSGFILCWVILVPYRTTRQSKRIHWQNAQAGT